MVGAPNLTQAPALPGAGPVRLPGGEPVLPLLAMPPVFYHRAWTALAAAGLALEVHALACCNPAGTASAYARSMTGCSRTRPRRATVTAVLLLLAAHLGRDSR